MQPQFEPVGTGLNQSESAGKDFALVTGTASPSKTATLTAGHQVWGLGSQWTQ